MCSAGKFLAGFIVGGAVGAIAGILLAPRTGEETREILSDKTTDVYGKAEESIKEIQSKANVVVDEIQKKGDELISKIQDLLNREKVKEG
jgi:gas vesicle protein